MLTRERGIRVQILWRLFLRRLLYISAEELKENMFVSSANDSSLLRPVILCDNLVLLYLDSNYLKYICYSYHVYEKFCQ